MATLVSSILTWSQYFWTRNLSPRNPEMLEHLYCVRPELNEKVSLWKGDVTKLEIDAIVNAAKSSLLGGGGVDGAIHDAAGPQMLEECKTLGGCNVGDAKVTRGYNLPAKNVIHAVGTSQQDPVELTSTYKSCFRLMLEQNFQSIAFPCISTGIYGYDPEAAAHIAIGEARNFLQENHANVGRIIFCVFGDSDLEIYEELLQRYFPIQSETEINAMIKRECKPDKHGKNLDTVHTTTDAL